MSKEFNQTLHDSLFMAEKLIELGVKGDKAATDDSCRILYAVMRDSGDKIVKLVNREIELHKEKGKWD